MRPLSLLCVLSLAPSAPAVAAGGSADLVYGELVLPLEVASAPEVMRVSFSAPDSRTILISVEVDGLGPSRWSLPSGDPAYADALSWWRSCEAGRCPAVEVEAGDLVWGYEPAGASAGWSKPEYKYVSIRRMS